MRRILALVLCLLGSPALAQTAGSINLFGPSTVPGAPQIGPAAINTAVNAALGLKLDAANPVFTGTMSGPNATIGTLGVTGTTTLTGTVSGTGITALLAPYALKASPTFSGILNGAAFAFTGNGSVGGTLGVTGTLSGAGITALLAPYAQLASPTFTGTLNAAAIAATGKISTAAGASGGAGLSLPCGAAPTSPVDGDTWMTCANGVFTRRGGATKGPLIDTATAPLTDTNGTIALGVQPAGFALNLDTVQNTTYQFKWIWATGTINNVDYYTGGSSTPSFSVVIQVAGIPVTCGSGITVSSATPANQACTPAAVTTGQFVSVIISATSGTPAAALIQVNGQRSAS